MTASPVNHLIEKLSADARPVAPLASPWRRAATTLVVFAAAGGVAIAASDTGALLARHAGRERQLASEMAAILLTGLLAVIGAFFVAVPGRSRWWFAAPLPSFLAWLLLSGAGCYAGLLSGDRSASDGGDSLHCLLFITGTSAALAIPLIWRLSLATPVEALRVALLAGLGSAALSAFLLAFFHPFDVTFLDLAVHLAAILLVTGTLTLLRRRALRPA